MKEKIYENDSGFAKKLLIITYGKAPLPKKKSRYSFLTFHKNRSAEIWRRKNKFSHIKFIYLGMEQLIFQNGVKFYWRQSPLHRKSYVINLFHGGAGNILLTFQVLPMLFELIRESLIQLFLHAIALCFPGCCLDEL